MFVSHLVFANHWLPVNERHWLEHHHRFVRFKHAKRKRIAHTRIYSSTLSMHVTSLAGTRDKDYQRARLRNRERTKSDPNGAHTTKDVYGHPVMSVRNCEQASACAFVSNRWRRQQTNRASYSTLHLSLSHCVACAEVFWMAHKWVRVTALLVLNVRGGAAAVRIDRSFWWIANIRRPLHVATFNARRTHIKRMYISYRYASVYGHITCNTHPPHYINYTEPPAYARVRNARRPVLMGQFTK